MSSVSQGASKRLVGIYRRSSAQLYGYFHPSRNCAERIPGVNIVFLDGLMALICIEVGGSFGRLLPRKPAVEITGRRNETLESQTVCLSVSACSCK